MRVRTTFRGFGPRRRLRRAFGFAVLGTSLGAAGFAWTGWYAAGEGAGRDGAKDGGGSLAAAGGGCGTSTWRGADVALFGAYEGGGEELVWLGGLRIERRSVPSSGLAGTFGGGDSPWFVLPGPVGRVLRWAGSNEGGLAAIFLI